MKDKNIVIKNLTQEIDELTNKISRLNTFLTEYGRGLKGDELKLLVEQRHHMRGYLFTMQLRKRFLNEKKDS